MHHRWLGQQTYSRPARPIPKETSRSYSASPTTRSNRSSVTNSCSRSRESRTKVLGRSNRLAALLAILLRKLAPKRLPDEGLRERLTELDVLGDLERRELGAAMRDDVLRGRSRSRP